MDTSIGTPPNELSVDTALAPNWLDQDGLLREMWLQDLTKVEIAQKLGRSVAAVMTRAVRLGLPRRAAPGRKPGRQPDTYRPTKRRVSASKMRETLSVEEQVAQIVAASEGTRQARICLMCLKKFPSEGRFNRICSSCKGTSGYVGSSSASFFGNNGES